MNILDRISYSNTTLIGYDAQNEISVQKLLKFLPSVILIEKTSDKEVFKYFNTLSHQRDFKLDSILNDDPHNFVVVDLTTLYFEEEEQEQPFQKIAYIRNFILQLQTILNNLSNTDSSSKFKLILLTGLYVGFSEVSTSIMKYRGGETPIYASDLVIKLLGDIISVEKDRIKDNRYINTIKQELRELSIKSLFDEITTTA